MKKEINLYYKSSAEDIFLKKGVDLQQKVTNELHYGGKVNKDSADNTLPEILFITSFPPRECGIATYSQDLIKALNNKFDKSFSIKVCALETTSEKFQYSNEVEYTINTESSEEYYDLADCINANNKIKIVLIQHEFGFFHANSADFISFLQLLTKPKIIVFHTVLPKANIELRENVRKMAKACDSIIVMTNNSEEILINDYQIVKNKINVIPHGTHLVPHLDKLLLKEKFNLKERKVLSTFGLLSSGKGIETTLEALPAIVKIHPEVLFLIIGKTHPGVVKHEGEKYRSMLEIKVNELHLQNHVYFVNQYLSLPDLLEYLQLTDIYLFTSKDPNQAVSGTFSYALSCGCPIISTPIPHAKEVLGDGTGHIIDFNNAKQLSSAVNDLLSSDQLRLNMSSNGLHKIVSTAWENAAVAHALLFKKIAEDEIILHYKMPALNLNHLKRLTTDFGMIQFSKINQPDIESGYTLDDNARALIAICQHYELTGEEKDVELIKIYFGFIKYCLQSEGYFLNYIDEQKAFTEQNNRTNLSDANGRAIWALGYLISIGELLSEEMITDAENTLQLALEHINTIHSTRAMAFAVKGLYYYNIQKKSERNSYLIEALANRLVQMYKHESCEEWEWFESYLTYANSILPEAMLCAYLETGNMIYKEIAKTSFDFLLSHTFNNSGIKVISNRGWKHKGETATKYGEQPIDVAYTVLALSRFYDVFQDKDYLDKLETAFNWFLGKNHLHRIIYNPCTGGCYDGLEEDHVNLNQGAESTVSYLMARLTVEKYFANEPNLKKEELKIDSLIMEQNKEIQFA